MNSIFTEENLLAFTTAARFGSFSKAAEELGLTTSAISYTIKRMETGLDVVLFTRSTRSIELTESGRYFFRKATDLLNDFYAPNGTYYTVAWNKLYRAEVWKLLHYPEGRLHEDDFVAHRLFWRCDKVVCLPDVLYNYRLRSGSIMRTSLKPGAFDAVDGLADRYRFYVENGADRSVIDSAYAACWRRYLFLCAKVRQNPEPQLVKAISKEQFLMQGLISYLPNCRHMKMTEKLSAARWAMMPAESLCPAK